METMSTLSRPGPLLMPPMAKVPRPKSADGSHTKPMRSSPLAGPAVNRSPPTFIASMASNELTDKSLILTTPPICYVLPPKSCETLDSLSDTTPTTLRRTRITASSDRSQSLYVPSTSDSGHAPRTAAAEWEIDPLQSLAISRTPVRPRTSLGIPSFRLPVPIVEEEPDWQIESDIADSSSKDTSRNSSTSEITPPRSASQPQVNSWYTTNTYDVTPRFSRLGLSASTVVMPLSPKEHRRLSKNSSLSRSSSSTSTATPTKRFFISSLNSKSSSPTPTRVSLQSSPPQPQSPLSRTFSNASSSETSSIVSNCQSETPTPISTSTSAPSLTRSKSSEGSISTCYESLPPTTPHLEHDTTLPAENDGEEGERDTRVKEEVDREMERVDEVRGLDHDHDHAQIHYSDITVTIKNDSDDDSTRPDPQPQSTPTPTPPTPQPTTNMSFLTPTFPKDVKKERGSIRKKLVRIKLQPVDDVDDLEDVSSSLLALNMNLLKTMTTMSMMTPITTPITKAVEVGRVAVGLPEVPVPVVLPTTMSIPTVMVNLEDRLLSASSISLPTPTMKKKRSTFRNVWRSFITGGGCGGR